jgi:transformation/transcription domain-associated protein
MKCIILFLLIRFWDMLQALYYWLRTYLMERRDVATKTEMGRNMLAQQRMQQAMLANNAANNLTGNMTSDSQAHQATQSGGATGSHEGGNLQGQEPGRSTVEGGTGASHDQGQQSSASAEGSQVPLRRNTGLSWITSAASAFDAAKDIMEALRSKHANLANELEVRNK